MASTRKKTVLTISVPQIGVPQNDLISWIKHKEDIISKYQPGQFGAKRQKFSVGKHDFIDKAVYKWFMNARKQNVPIGGHIIREKALDFAKELNIMDFKDSERWLDWWKNRRNAVF